MFEPTTESLWYSADDKGTFTVGSGDKELATRLPLEFARLFVAAPTMFSALEHLIAVHDGAGECEEGEWKQARAAIKAAS